MSISGTEVTEALARSVTVREEALSADLTDGGTIAVPLACFRSSCTGHLRSAPTGVSLVVARESTARIWTISARKGFWREGRSGETQESLWRWLEARKAW